MGVFAENMLAGRRGRENFGNEEFLGGGFKWERYDTIVHCQYGMTMILAFGICIAVLAGVLRDLC